VPTKYCFAPRQTLAYGPAGTGKTWLAVACAVSIKRRASLKLLLVAPGGEEAGENWVSCRRPGAEVDPTFARCTTSYEMLALKPRTRLIEKSVIGLHRWRVMRGRTLKQLRSSILDESQHTTREQMKIVP